jgi:hypothetical protein
MRTYHFIVLGTMLIFRLNTFAQGEKLASKDLGRIPLATAVVEPNEGLPQSAKSLLESKLNQIATSSGVSGNAIQTRFVLAATVFVISKDITPTTPVMQAYTLEISMVIGDGIDGTKFSNYTTTVKGVGENETKAYLSALKSIEPNDAQYQPFVNKGKAKIVEYYNNKCDALIKESRELAKRNEYDAAISKLAAVPDACVECFKKVNPEITIIYKYKIDQECKVELSKASSIWSVNQDLNAANDAGQILANINPQSTCYTDVKQLYEKIAKRVKELDKREWDLKLKQQQADEEESKALINAARDIGVAYGNNQPKVVSYNFRGWW